jgi:hypothetical protein
MATPLRRALVIVLCILLFSCVPRPAAAQILTSWNAFAGYAYMKDLTDRIDFKLGWAADAAVGLNSWLSIVADAGGHYETVPLVGSDVRLAEHSLMAGGRASVHVGDFVEFGQLMAGLVHARGTAYGSTSADTHPGVQGGGGVDYPLSPKLAVRLEFDARFLDTSREIRATAGIVYTFR